jgi:Mrp family chromosome partitioning ATPase
MTFPFELKEKKFILNIKNMQQQILVGNDDKPIKSVLITSVAYGHGVSTVATNLAYALASASESKVLLVDGNRAGLAKAENFNVALQKPLTKKLFVIMTPWCETSKPGTRFVEHFEKLSNVFSYIVIDAPPVTKVPEVLRAVPLVDLVLLLLQANATKWQVLSKAQETIEEAKPKSLKVVLNRKKHYIPRRFYRWM